MRGRERWGVSEGVITALGLSFTGPPASSHRPSADEALVLKKPIKCSMLPTHARAQSTLEFTLQREREKLSESSDKREQREEGWRGDGLKRDKNEE